MKTIILDDDPTGTQSATNVDVVFGPDKEGIKQILQNSDSVYVQTNSRSIPEGEAVELVTKIRDISLSIGNELGTDIQFVLRGDSTLRGHVFAESSVFATPDSILIFVPAFPDGGRTTKEGTHYVRLGNQDIPAADTEYAADPVFPFKSSNLVEYVAEKAGQTGYLLDANTVQSSEAVAAELLAQPPGSIIVADAVTNEDIRRIADGIRAAQRNGATIVVRSAAPLAAELARVSSKELLPLPLVLHSVPTLVVCGSHTDGATAQLNKLSEKYGEPICISTEAAFTDPQAAGLNAATGLQTQLATTGLAILCSERQRRPEDNTLEHGEKVMLALTTAVQKVKDEVQAVITKGGITSSQIAEVGLGVTKAHVLGQIMPGVSAWKVPVSPDGRLIFDVIVPGNVGDENTLVRAVEALGW